MKFLNLIGGGNQRGSIGNLFSGFSSNFWHGNSSQAHRLKVRLSQQLCKSLRPGSRICQEASSTTRRESGTSRKKRTFANYSCSRELVLCLGRRRGLGLDEIRRGWCNGVKRGPELAIRASSGGSLGKKGSSKTKVHFVCDNCGESYGQWWGTCNSCKEMNTLKEFRESLPSAGPGGGAAARAVEHINITKKGPVSVEDSTAVRKGAWLNMNDVGPQRLSDVAKGFSQQLWRLSLPGETGLEVSRVLGGGIVPGSVILVGGDPGVGKSTLLLQVAGMLALVSNEEEPAPVLYVSGEESVEQICNRADRMQITAHELFLYSATDLELVLEAIQKLAPKAVIVDSIQTVYLPEATGSAGSVVQVKECAAALLRLAKQTSIPIFLVGHVTKTGDIAGPRVLEHIVDVVLYMEGERLQSHRLLRVHKNRYGSSDEVGVFEMVEGGLEAITNPSALFLSERASDSNITAAAAVAVTMEGSRPILSEVQALCSGGSNQQACRRTANGIDGQRLYLLLAVLMKQVGLKLQNQDVFINVVGGLQLREPASDLAVAVAICSSLLEKPVPRDMAFIGEIGLGGEIRTVGQLDRRIGEAAKLGFKTCVVPRSSKKSIKGTDQSITKIPCADVKEVLHKALGWSQ